MKNTTLTLLFLGLLLLARPAAADDDFTEVNLILGAHSEMITDNAYDYYSNDDWHGAGYLAFEVEVWHNLFVQLGIDMSDSRLDLFDRYDTALRIREPRLGVRYGYTFLDAIRPYASVAATYAFMRTDISLWDDHVTGYEDGWGDGELGGRFAAGCEFFLPRRIFGKDRTGLFKDFTLGLAIEAGYALSQPFELDRMEHGKDGNLSKEPPLTAGQLDLGELDKSGFFLAFDFRFYF
jgi:hypothetical protein